jgi:acetylornithine deacetylase/succinyl-diaminopimelate desuccinylase-like protein
VVFGVRGYTGLELTVYGPAADVHSGHYGNWVPNPALQLAHLLASLRTPEGEVLVEGFEDDTRPPTDAELAAVAALPDDDALVAAALGLGRTEGDGERLVARLLRPSCNVRGIRAGGVGGDARNVVPATATASIDVRLALGDDPTRMLDRIEAHLVRQGAHVVHEEPDLATRRAHPLVVRVDRDEGYPGLRTPLDDPAVAPVVDAVGRAHGEPVLQPTLGGSVPMHGLATVLGAPLVIVPIANHDDDQHAPDENIRIGNLLDGVVTMAALLTERS